MVEIFCPGLHRRALSCRVTKARKKETQNKTKETGKGESDKERTAKRKGERTWLLLGNVRDLRLRAREVAIFAMVSLIVLFSLATLFSSFYFGWLGQIDSPVPMQDEAQYCCLRTKRLEGQILHPICYNLIVEMTLSIQTF